MTVSVAVSTLGASSMHVLEPEVKINGGYEYCRVAVLKQILLPDIRAASGSEVNAPSHRANDTLALLDLQYRDAWFCPTRSLAG